MSRPSNHFGSTRAGAQRLAIAIIFAVSLSQFGQASSATAQTSTAIDAPSRTGDYLIWGTDAEATAMPYVQGGQVDVNWSRIEPTRGSFDWTSLAAQLKVYHAAGKPATVQVNSNTKPTWIYNHGIEKCGTYTRNGYSYDIPKYWDPNFHVMMQEMLDSLAAHLRGSPYRAAVLGVRAQPNLIGTEPHLFTDPGASPTEACAADWTLDKANAAYEKSMRLTYNAMMPDIRPILRSNFFLAVNKSPAVRTELLGQNKAWMFGTNSDPDRTLATVDNLYHEWVKTGRTRGYYESLAPSTNHQLSWAYWRQLMELGRGVGYIATYASDLRGAEEGMPDSEEYRAAFDFANKYAGFSDKPALTPGGWVAFRGGGGATDDNYEMFVTQLNADGTPGADATTVAVASAGGTSVIGPADQRFGRFARRTDIASGRSKIYLRVAPQYKDTLVDGSHVAVTYLDQGTGNINVKWGTRSVDQQTFTKANTGQWRRVVVDVPSGAMVGGLEATADVVVSVTGSDTMFHMVEVERAAEPVAPVAPVEPVEPVTPDIGMGSSTSAKSYADTLTINAPPAAPGQVLVASISAIGQDVGITKPAGWTLIRRTDQVGDVNQALYYRVVGGSEPTSHTWTMSRKHSVAGIIQSFTDVDTAAPVEASSGIGGNGDASITAPSVTTLGPKRLVVGLYSVAAATDIRPATHMTEIAEVSFDTRPRPPVTLEASILPVSVAGATGDKSATVAAGTTAPHVGQLLVLKPRQ